MILLRHCRKIKNGWTGKTDINALWLGQTFRYYYITLHTASATKPELATSSFSTANNHKDCSLEELFGAMTQLHHTPLIMEHILESHRGAVVDMLHEPVLQLQGDLGIPATVRKGVEKYWNHLFFQLQLNISHRSKQMPQISADKFLS